MAEHKKRLTSLTDDLRCRRKDVREFLRGVAHTFGSHSWIESRAEEQQEESMTEEPRDATGNERGNVLDEDAHRDEAAVVHNDVHANDATTSGVSFLFVWPLH
jgi:hypothetical protein